MLRELNKDLKHTKLRSIVDRWEKLERYKYWKSICYKNGPIDRMYPDGRWIGVFAKFAQHFMSKDGFRIYEVRRVKREIFFLPKKPYSGICAPIGSI